MKYISQIFPWWYTFTWPTWLTESLISRYSSTLFCYAIHFYSASPSMTLSEALSTTALILCPSEHVESWTLYVCQLKQSTKCNQQQRKEGVRKVQRCLRYNGAQSIPLHTSIKVLNSMWVCIGDQCSSSYTGQNGKLKFPYCLCVCRINCRPVRFFLTF